MPRKLCQLDHFNKNLYQRFLHLVNCVKQPKMNFVAVTFMQQSRNRNPISKQFKLCSHFDPSHLTVYDHSSRPTLLLSELSGNHPPFCFQS